MLVVAGEGPGLGVVAVAVAQREAVPVQVGELVGGRVAVVVDAVADLVRVRVHGRRGVVAVARDGHVALGLGAVGGDGAGVAEAVPVVVRVPGQGVDRARVDGAVAVVVDPVADLVDVRIHVGVQVVAVALAGGDPVAVRVEALVHLAVAVVVDAVAVLEGRRVHLAVVVVAVSGAGCETIAIHVEALVHVPVAVVVHEVAQLGGPRVDLGQQVVAVAGAGGDPVPVPVETVVDHAIAVVVDAIAVLDRVRVHRRVVVVAVAVADRDPVPVDIEALVHVPVAVVVDAVAGFDGVRVHGWIGVVAVAPVGDPAHGLHAGEVGGRVVTEPVPVPVLVPGVATDGVLPIDHPVTVVVDAVAELGRARVDGRIQGIAVALVEGEAVPVPVQTV